MSEGVSVRVEEVTIPTTEGPIHSPYSRFGWSGWRSTYPYSTQTDLTSELSDRPHRIVTLENEYVLIAVLPDMGGRVYRMYDKLAGEETFMVPPTMRFQNISNRGAWLAGGIELNFGHRGHTCHTVNPVSWTMRRDEDGGASVWVGSVIRPIGSRWAVRIRLAPHRAAMDLEIHTMGPPDLPGMMYYWSNAAVETTDQSRFFYFGRYAHALHYQHGWPIADGLDYRWVRNRLVGADMFLMGAERDYLGFYDYGRSHGLAQTADRRRAPGQKYFTWGTHMQGRYWDRMFSDTGQTYCEIQRGRLPTQGMTEPIAPMACETWSETWMPIAGSEGFSAVENDLVLSAPEPDDEPVLRLLTARPMEGLQMTARAGDSETGRWRIDRIAPGEMFAQPIEGGVDRVTVADSAGRTLMDWTEFEFDGDDWFRDSVGQIDIGPGPVDQRFADAERLRFLRWPDENGSSGADYEQIVAEDPGHSGAHGALAQIALHAGRFEDALEHLRAALKRRPLDPPLQALLGWTLLAVGDDAGAVEAFAAAARQDGHRRVGLVGQAWAHLHTGDAEAALQTVDRLLAERPLDKWGRLLRVIALRVSGRRDEASEVAGELLHAEPIWSPVVAEAALLGIDADLADGTRTLTDDSITAATPYLGIGLWADARELLTRDESDEPFSPAVRLAHLAYACRKLGDSEGEQAAIDAVADATDHLAHPWTTTSIAVLTELADAWPDSPHLHAMLGNVLADRCRLGEARAAWARAAELGMPGEVLHANMARAAMHFRETDAALEHFETAWARSDRTPDLYSLFDRFLASIGRHDRREQLHDELDEATRGRSMAAMRRLTLLLDQRRYADALEELATRDYLRGEGEKTIRYQYLEAVVGRAGELMAGGDLDAAEAMLKRGLEYPRNLNTGRHGSTPDEAIVHYHLGLLAEMRGRTDDARAHWTEAAEEIHHDGSPMLGYEMLAWLALGRRPRALRLAHDAEQLARGEGDIPWWYHFHFGSDTPQLNHGFAQLVKGHVDRARKLWSDTLAKSPDARWLPLHTALPDDILNRMARRITGPA